MSNSDKLKDYIEQWKFDLVTAEDLDFLTEVADELEEIESLREQVAHEERRAKVAEFAGIEAMKRGDEWKHRTKCLHDILDREGLLQAHAESADWFKEEK